ncbi:MAG: hypothetical protein GTO02_16430 [Candidatus Dadabacteria bacterium]|nr:hypothetical protein [Candidatus Dadabacteria bacterium]
MNLIIRVEKKDQLLPKYLYYVLKAYHVNGVFKQYSKLVKNDIRNMTLQKTGNDELSMDVERLGDLIKVYEENETEVQTDDILIRVDGEDIGDVKLCT